MHKDSGRIRCRDEGKLPSRFVLEEIVQAAERGEFPRIERVLDGLEATRRIKATEAGAGTLIVALTARALEEERNEIMAAGCDDFVRP